MVGEYRARGMRDLPHRLGFSSKKPRPTKRGVSKKEWDDFKKGKGSCQEILRKRPIGQ